MRRVWSAGVVLIVVMAVGASSLRAQGSPRSPHSSIDLQRSGDPQAPQDPIRDKGEADRQEGTAAAPRIGLVLSGGGALGAAHVGVLKVIEELRVPVHCIAGTSMGAIVGGLYASGTSPEEMRHILSTLDWRAMLDDRPPRREMPYRRKEDDLTYLTRLEVGFSNGRFRVPPGLVAGQQFGFELQRLVLGTAGIRDFDRLPIPFRAVATDVETGEMVILGRGDLAHAMRASMSVPGVFSPISIDGRLLVDGGLVRNLPVDVVRAMGADVVIAVDVAPPLPDKDELRSLTRLSSQIVSLMIRRNVESQYPGADVLIRPDTEGYRSMEFERALELVDRGEAAARQLTEALTQYSLDADAYAAYSRRFNVGEPRPATLASVQLAVASTADPELVLEKVRSRPGDQLDVMAVRRDLQGLYELGDYERVDFFLMPADGSGSSTGEGEAEGTRGGPAGVDTYDLHIEAHEKSWGPNYLRFGIGLFSDLAGESGFNFGSSYTMTRLNRLRGELKLETQLGESLLFAAEYYQPLVRGERWFLAPWIEHTTETRDLSLGGDRFAEYRVDQLRGGLDLGLGLGKYGEVRLGATLGGAKGKLRKGPPLVADRDVGWGGYRLRAVIDQFDDPNFPREGYLLQVEGFAARSSLGADDQYDRLWVSGGGAFSVGSHTVLALAELDSAAGSQLPFYDRFALGGLFELSGLPFDSLEGQYGGVAALLYSYRVMQLPSTLGDAIYVGCSAEAGNLWETRQEMSLGDLRYSGSVFVGADTLLGPAYLGLGYADSGDTAWYLYIGRVF